MKIYLLLLACALAGSTAFGYYSGKDVAQERFAATCEATRFAVVYDRSSDAHRHFHCFELDAEAIDDQKKRASLDGQLVL